jgi:hypothetical protein
VVTSLTAGSGGLGCGAKGVPVGDAPRRPEGMRRDEMRPITALFADIVGSTGLGERMLAEPLSLAGEDVGPGSMARQ